jgi:hypothetical protein
MSAVVFEPLVAFEQPATVADELAGKPGRVRFLEVPSHRFIMIDGEGQAGEATFAPRMPGLYTAAWSLRFALKRRGVVTKVGPLEGLWWTSTGLTDLDAIFGDADRATWRWTLLIGLPDEATDAELAEALELGRSKLTPPYADSLRVEPFAEGPCAQVLHLGTYAAERPTIETLHAAIRDAAMVPRDRHHELYLGDPSRSAPERLRTLLRQPVAPGPDR